jgi:CBS domain containing-hemolysin-like protein
MVLGGVALVVLSEATARDAGDRAGLGGLQRTRGFIETVERGLFPVVLLGEGLDRSLTAMLPPSPPSDEEVEASVEKFRHVVTAEADVGRRASSLLAGVFSLGDRTVADVMTPRIDIVGIESSSTWDEVVACVRSSEHSRLVVHDGSLDGVVGVLFAKDLLPYIVADEPPAAGWLSLVRPPPFVPPTKRVDAQLRDFRATRGHIAIVADEFGGTAGLVTIEDLLELIVGEIHDERDDDEPVITQEHGNRYWVAGRLSLDQLSAAVGDDLRHDEVTTIAGLAYELFGRVPRAGESVDFRSWRLVVDRVRGRRIERVFLERLGVPVGAQDGE